MIIGIERKVRPIAYQRNVKINIASQSRISVLEVASSSAKSYNIEVRATF